MKVEQKFQCPKCLHFLEKLEINKWNFVPHCSNCNSNWKITIKCEDELKILYEEDNADYYI